MEIPWAGIRVERAVGVEKVEVEAETAVTPEEGAEEEPGAEPVGSSESERPEPGPEPKPLLPEPEVEPPPERTSEPRSLAPPDVAPPPAPAPAPEPGPLEPEPDQEFPTPEPAAPRVSYRHHRDHFAVEAEGAAASATDVSELPVREPPTCAPRRRRAREPASLTGRREWRPERQGPRTRVVRQEPVGPGPGEPDAPAGPATAPRWEPGSPECEHVDARERPADTLRATRPRGQPPEVVREAQEVLEDVVGREDYKAWTVPLCPSDPSLGRGDNPLGPGR